MYKYLLYISACFSMGAGPSSNQETLKELDIRLASDGKPNYINCNDLKISIKIGVNEHEYNPQFNLVIGDRTLNKIFDSRRYYDDYEMTEIKRENKVGGKVVDISKYLIFKRDYITNTVVRLTEKCHIYNNIRDMSPKCASTYYYPRLKVTIAALGYSCDSLEDVLRDPKNTVCPSQRLYFAIELKDELVAQGFKLPEEIVALFWDNDSVAHPIKWLAKRLYRSDKKFEWSIPLTHVTSILLLDNRTSRWAENSKPYGYFDTYRP